MNQSQPGKYRKRPVVIEAMELTRETYRDVIKWAADNGTELTVREDWAMATPENGLERDGWLALGLHVPTIEGLMRASFGDFIIKGVRGEFYPCDGAIFRATYDSAEDGADGANPATVPTWEESGHLNSLTGVPTPATAAVLEEYTHE